MSNRFLIVKVPVDKHFQKVGASPVTVRVREGSLQALMCTCRSGRGVARSELLLNPGSVMKYEPDNSSLGKFRKMFFDTPNIFQLN